MAPKGDGKTYKAEAALILQETPKSDMTSHAVEESMTSQTASKVDSTINDALSNGNEVCVIYCHIKLV